MSGLKEQGPVFYSARRRHAYNSLLRTRVVSCNTSNTRKNGSKYTIDGGKIFITLGKDT
jgi:hypothetical protein